MEVHTMSQGAELLAVLNQVREFFQETSSLLSTADAMMQKHAWRPTKGGQVTADMSWALANARLWMPHYLCRSYRREANAEVLASISIILGMFEGNPDDQKRLSEPLVCASLFQYDSGGKTDEWRLEFSTWHLWMPDRRDDGTVCSVDPRAAWPEEKWTAARLHTFAIPLFELSSAKDLQHRIVDPLLKLSNSAV